MALYVENEISEAVIGAAIEVHRNLGPGMLESVYERALCHELKLRGIKFERQVAVPVIYKGAKLGADLILDLLVDGKVIVEIKAKEAVTVVDRAQLLSYLRLANLRLGLLVNFHHDRLIDGVARIVNKMPDEPTPRPGF